MGLLLLIPGLILSLVHPAWFHGQYQVGHILIWTGAILILLQVIWVVFIVGMISRRR